MQTNDSEQNLKGRPILLGIMTDFSSPLMQPAGRLTALEPSKESDLAVHGGLQLPDDLFALVLTKLALQDPGALLAASCACKAFRFAASSKSPLWKQAFYGCLQEPRENPEEEALQTVVRRFGGYKHLVRARWARERAPKLFEKQDGMATLQRIAAKLASEKIRNVHILEGERPVTRMEELEDLAENFKTSYMSFLFLIRTLEGRLFMWGTATEHARNLVTLPGRARRAVPAYMACAVYGSIGSCLQLVHNVSKLTDEELALRLSSRKKKHAEDLASEPAMFLESYVFFGGAVAPLRLYGGPDRTVAHDLEVDDTDEKCISLSAWERVFVPIKERFVEQETLRFYVKGTAQRETESFAESDKDSPALVSPSSQWSVELETSSQEYEVIRENGNWSFIDLYQPLIRRSMVHSLSWEPLPADDQQQM